MNMQKGSAKHSVSQRRGLLEDLIMLSYTLEGRR
ncbi:hypothetical protein COLO4_08638 [Corchorus olitorius]|uniref:Uncharacterized protein n=1 Tax=Corchorus olitorius TaxID=93759 RepID=A0A1R3KF85_9ROSI|nr:hypothetical protein COLO4_08638 [Corchorus olitorius]